MTFDFQWRGDLRTQSAACCSMQVSDVVFIRLKLSCLCTCMHLCGPPQYNTCRLLVRSKWTPSYAGIVFWWILGQHGCSTVLFLDKYWVYCIGGDQLFDCVFCDLCCHDFYCLRFLEKDSEQIKTKMIVLTPHKASKSRLSVFVTVQFIIYELPICYLIVWL